MQSKALYSKVMNSKFKDDEQPTTELYREIGYGGTHYLIKSAIL